MNRITGLTRHESLSVAHWLIGFRKGMGSIHVGGDSTFSFTPRSNESSSQVAHQARAYLSFCSMKRLGVFLLPPE